MREYVIMTDSCCDLTDHMAKELGLAVVPLTVHIDGHDYPNMLDGSAISFEDFYGKIRNGVLATTSAANVGQFQEAMRPILAEGKDIVSINFSSALSTTYQSACIAAQDMKEEFPDANIYVWTPCPPRWVRGCCCIWRRTRSRRVCPPRSWCSGWRTTSCTLTTGSPWTT